MTVNQSLLEEMSAHMGCVYLSDLHYLSFGQRKKLAHKLQRMTPREDDMDQWNEALQYSVSSVHSSGILSYRSYAQVKFINTAIQPQEPGVPTGDSAQRNLFYTLIALLGGGFGASVCQRKRGKGARRGK